MILSLLSCLLVIFFFYLIKPSHDNISCFASANISRFTMSIEYRKHYMIIVTICVLVCFIFLKRVVATLRSCTINNGELVKLDLCVFLNAESFSHFIISKKSIFRRAFSRVSRKLAYMINIIFFIIFIFGSVYVVISIKLLYLVMET